MSDTANAAFVVLGVFFLGREKIDRKIKSLITII